MYPHLQLLCFLLLVNHSLSFPKNRKMLNFLDMAIGNFPNIVDIYSGERSVAKMGWPEINSLGKAILNQLEVAQDNMMELKDDFENHSVVTLRNPSQAIKIFLKFQRPDQEVRSLQLPLPQTFHLET